MVKSVKLNISDFDQCRTKPVWLGSLDRQQTSWAPRNTRVIVYWQLKLLKFFYLTINRLRTKHKNPKSQSRKWSQQDHGTLFGPQRSIYVRFRRTRDWFPSPTLYSIIHKGLVSHLIPKNRLSQVSSDKRPRANTYFWVVTGVSVNWNSSKTGPRGRNID